MEIAVRKGNGYWGILDVTVSYELDLCPNYIPFPEENGGEHDPEVTAGCNWLQKSGIRLRRKT